MSDQWERKPIYEDMSLVPSKQAMTTRAKVAAILDGGPTTAAHRINLRRSLSPHWMALWAAAEAEGHERGGGRWPECVSCEQDWPCPMTVALAALNAAAESEIKP